MNYGRVNFLRSKKISETFRKKKIDNFKKWRDGMKRIGKMPTYSLFIRSEDLAEYIGVVLGDGNISSFPRTERLIIVGNSNNIGFIRRYSLLTEKIFGKIPRVTKISGVNAIRISIYQKFISERLDIPSGNRAKYIFKIPAWILSNKRYIASFLRGLFEAEGSFSIHLPTCTYNFSFSNRNVSLLDEVERALVLLGFHPERRDTEVRLRKRQEALAFETLISFRKYTLV